MKKEGAFSLIEVVLALGILVFALVGILGLFPVGLDSARQGISDTRGQQLAHSIFSALRDSPYDGVKVYGKTIDLSSVNSASSPVLWYAKYPDPNPPEITPTSDPDSIYTLEATFANPPPGVDAASAKQVSLKIYPNLNPSAALHFVSIIGDY